MEPQTDGANTSDWIRATEGIKIVAHVPLSGESSSVTIESQLNQEFQSWDILSDEAFINFEATIGHLNV